MAFAPSARFLYIFLRCKPAEKSYDTGHNIAFGKALDLTPPPNAVSSGRAGCSVHFWGNALYFKFGVSGCGIEKSKTPWDTIN